MPCVLQVQYGLILDKLWDQLQGVYSICMPDDETVLRNSYLRKTGWELHGLSVRYKVGFDYR